MSCFNKFLLASFSTNYIAITVTDEEFKKIDYNIKRLKQIYQKEVNNLYSNRSLYMMNKHCLLVQKIISEVIALFPIMKEYGTCAFLTGSFARCSCKKNSDLDFHIIYTKKYDDESFKYEEIIYYMLSEILNLGRNKIHPMLLTKMHPAILTYLEETLDNNDLNITIKSNAGKYNYKINANLKRRLYLQYCRENTIEKVFAYLKQEVDHKNSEWAHVIRPITMKEEFNNYYNELYKYEKNNINYSNIISRINHIKEKINKINLLFNTIDHLNISEFKNVYQKKEFGLINEYISLKRDICLYNGIDWPTINYYANLTHLSSDQVFTAAIEYMFLLFDITEPLGNRYSLHTNELIRIDYFDNIKNKMIELNKKIMSAVLIEEEQINGKISHNDANSSIPKILSR